MIGPPLKSSYSDVITPARAALAAGRPAKAMVIFLQGCVGLPRRQAAPAGLASALVPKYRRLIPCQLDAQDALDRLGVRLDTYATIEVPVVLLGGDRSPANITQRLDAIERVMPHTERAVMRGRDHGADLKHPKQVAAVIEELAGKVLHRTR